MLITLQQNTIQQVVWAAGAQRLGGLGVKSWLIANRDETHQIRIGPSDNQRQAPDLTDPDTRAASLIDPLGSIQVGPGMDWFAVSPGAAVQVDIIPDCSYWAPSPAQVATQISALGLMLDTTGQGLNTGIPANIATTGAPLLRNEVAIASSTTASIPIGSSASIGPFALNTPSYELRVTLTAATLQAECNGEIVLKWSNSGGTVLLAQKTFSAIASTGGHQLTVTGPIRGSSLTIQFVNPSSSLAAITVGYTLVASSRLAANDLFRTIQGTGAGPPTTVTWSGVNMDSGILANAAPTVGTLATASRGLGAYNGPCQLAVDTGSGTSDCEVAISLFDTTIAANYANIFRSFTDAKGRLNALFNMPMAQCLLSVVNNNAAGQVISFIMTTAETNVN